METQFLGSAMDNETVEEHLERELKWKEEHSCSICGSFECNGDCELNPEEEFYEHQDTWYDYAEKAGILEAEGCE